MAKLRLVGLVVVGLGFLIGCHPELRYVTNQPSLLFLEAMGVDQTFLNGTADRAGFRLLISQVPSDQVLGLVRDQKLSANGLKLFAQNNAVPDKEWEGIRLFPPPLDGRISLPNLEITGFQQLANRLHDLVAATPTLDIRVIVPVKLALAANLANLVRLALAERGLTFDRIELPGLDLGLLRQTLTEAKESPAILIFCGPITDPGVFNELSAPEYRTVIWNAGQAGQLVAGCLGAVSVDYPELWRRSLADLRAPGAKSADANLPTVYQAYR